MNDVVTVPAALLQDTLNYMQERPWREVAGLLDAWNQVFAPKPVEEASETLEPLPNLPAE